MTLLQEADQAKQTGTVDVYVFDESVGLIRVKRAADQPCPLYALQCYRLPRS